MKIISFMLNKIRIYISDDSMFVFGSFMSNVQYQEIENRCLMVLFDLLRRQKIILFWLEIH